jgi:hypothetical protein
MSSLTDDPERQPLLPPGQQSVESSETTGNVTTSVTNDDLLPIQADASEPDGPDLERKTYLSTVLWYTVWLAVGTLTLVLFIKGFMDACDVDVSLLYCIPRLTEFDMLGSSISRRLSRVLSEAG